MDRQAGLSVLNPKARVNKLRLARFGLLAGAPVAIALHVVTARSEIRLLRALGLILAVGVLLYFTWLAYVACPRCGQPFFGRFSRHLWGPWGLFRRAPRCTFCSADLRS